MGLNPARGIVIFFRRLFCLIQLTSPTMNDEILIFQFKLELSDLNCTKSQDFSISYIAGRIFSW